MSDCEAGRYGDADVVALDRGFRFGDPLTEPVKPIAQSRRFGFGSEQSELFTAEARDQSEIRRLLTHTDDAHFPQIDLAARVHLALDELEFADLTFGLAVRPCRGNRSLDRVSIPDNPIRKRGNEAPQSTVEPSIEFGKRFVADDRLELCEDIPRLCKPRDVAFVRRDGDRLRLAKLIVSDLEYRRRLNDDPIRRASAEL